LVREQAERHLEVDPLVPLPYRHLARAAESLGDTATAISAYRVLLLMDPANPAEHRFRMARLLHLREDGEAKVQLLRSLEEAPRNREALQLLLRMDGGRSAGNGAPSPGPVGPRSPEGRGVGEDGDSFGSVEGN